MKTTPAGIALERAGFLKPIWKERDLRLILSLVAEVVSRDGESAHWLLRSHLVTERAPANRELVVVGTLSKPLAAVPHKSPQVARRNLPSLTRQSLTVLRRQTASPPHYEESHSAGPPSDNVLMHTSLAAPQGCQRAAQSVKTCTRPDKSFSSQWVEKPCWR